MSTHLAYLLKIAASAHVITLQRLTARVADVNTALQALLDLPAPEVQQCKHYLARATETLAELAAGVQLTDGHVPAMEEWHRVLLEETMESAEARKTEAGVLVAKVEALVVRFEGGSG